MMRRQRNTIEGTTLVECHPEDSGDGSSRVVVPQGVTRIAGSAFNFRANYMSVVVPDSVERIDEDTFDTIKFTDLYGIPGGCADDFARSHSNPFHQVRFYSNAFPSRPVPRRDERRSVAEGFEPALAGALLWESPGKAEGSGVLLPRSLFDVEVQDTPDGDMMVYYHRLTVVMRTPGKLELEYYGILYDGYDPGRNTTPHTLYSDLDFEALPGMIERSKDERARCYAGMNAGNWEDYLRVALEDSKPSRLPLVAFGSFPALRYQPLPMPLYWYVLEVSGDRALLLCRDGLIPRQWDDTNVQKIHGTFITKRGKACSWETSQLRHWLREEAPELLFTGEERRFICGDGLTCLSVEEFDRCLSGDPAAEARPTGFAVGAGAFIFIPTKGTKTEYLRNAGRTIWWLRDEKGRGWFSEDDSHVACVSMDGAVMSAWCDKNIYCVRPAVWVSLEFFRGRDRGL